MKSTGPLSEFERTPGSSQPRWSRPG